MLDYLVASFVFVCIPLPESAVSNRQSFGDGLEGTATLLPVLLQLVPHSVRLFPRVVLFIPEPSSALFVLLVRLQKVCGRNRILVIFKSAILRRNSIVCKEVEGGAVCGESRDLGVAPGVGCPEMGEGLVPGVDKGRSVISALQPRFRHILSASLPLSGQMWQC